MADQNHIRHTITRWAITIMCIYIILSITFLIIFIIIYNFLRSCLKYPTFTVEGASIVRGYNLTSDNFLNAAFIFEVKTYNPNTKWPTKLPAYYEFLEIRVYRDGQAHQLLGYEGMYPFTQPYGNVTCFKFGSVVRNMPLFRSVEHVSFVFKIHGRLNLKINILGSIIDNRFEAKCSPMVVYFNDSARGFVRPDCDFRIVEFYRL